MSFFDDDFAGRIAQKQQQTARAITDAVSETVNTLGLAVTAIIGAVAVVGAVNLWLALAMAVWLAGYAVLIRHYMPRIRARSKARAAARAVVTGQVVDTITNIATVKLFSHGAARGPGGAATRSPATAAPRSTSARPAPPSASG